MRCRPKAETAKHQQMAVAGTTAADIINSGRMPEAATHLLSTVPPFHDKLSS
jgi:hypothetical protein